MTEDPKKSPRRKQSKGKPDEQTPAASIETPAPAEQGHGTETTPATSQPAGEIPLAADVGDTPANENHPRQRRQKDKDQQGKARKVDAQNRKVFEDEIGSFQKWRDQWLKKTEGYRQERAEIEGQMFDASPRMRSKGKKGAKDSPAKAKKRQELRARLNRLDKDQPPDDPWEQVREVANHGSDDHEHNLMAYMFPAKLEPPESESHIRCLQYVRLGILRDMALRGDAGVRPITYGVLDAGEVEATWNDMDRNWWVGWADAIGTAITAVEASARQEGADGGVKGILCPHTSDFRSLTWFGSPYSFTGYQAACVRIWYQQWRTPARDVSDATVLEAADCASNRVSDVFKRSKAWTDKIIVEGATRGTHRLREPTEPKPPERKRNNKPRRPSKK